MTPLKSSNPMKRHMQQGVVLIIALIMLVIISLLATFSIRNAVSTEAISGNVRTTQLATQAAEIALRYCEEGVRQGFSGSPTYTVSPILSYSTTSRWKDLANWDGATSLTGSVPTNLVVVPTSALGGTSTFRREPECMIERMNVLNSAGAISTTSTFVITARGFGPEVEPADASRNKPMGSEAWMQSTISFK